MASKQVEIPQIGIVNLYKKRGNTHIRMSFARDGSLRVSLPYWLPYQAGVNFAVQRSSWIEKHRPTGQSLLEDNDHIGKAHRLVFVADAAKPRPTVRVGKNQILVTHPMTSLLTSKLVQEAAKRGAHRALKLEADQLLPQRLEQLAHSNGFSYRGVSTKRLSSRWGSCSQHKEITLNIYLMQLPWHLIDYVLVHELVHTEHLDHSQAFWKRFEQAMPDAKNRRKQMKQYRTVIMPTQDPSGTA